MGRNTLLSLLILLGIALYLGASLRTDRPAQTGPCQARPLLLTRSGAEIRLRYQGAAEAIELAWPGGGLRVRTLEACTGLACRLSLPQPGLAGVRLRLDGCPWVEVP